MSIRNFDRLFNPKSVALIGASNRPRSIGQVLAANLFSAGFKGPIWPVNLHEKQIAGQPCYRSVASLPASPDLAVIATPAAAVTGVIADLVRRQCRAAVIVSAGFGEGADQQGAARAQVILDSARTVTMRVIGPNCLGIAVPGIGLNASFAQLNPGAGDLAFVTQSGAIITSMLDWCASRDIGFSHVVSLGDMCDVDFGDMLDYLAADDRTAAILLYIEQVREARKFMSAARAASRSKPVIVVKAGRSRQAAQAAMSHTGALAGSDAVYDAALRRAGMLRVADIDELFEAAATLATGQKLRSSHWGDRLAIISNGGGTAVLATDALIGAGGGLAPLDRATIEALNKLLPAHWSGANPVDILGDADGARYGATLQHVLADRNVDAVLVLHSPTAITPPEEAADAVIAAAPHARVPLLVSWVGAKTVAEARRRFIAAHVPSYDTPSQAVRGFMHLVNYRRNRDMLMETPASVPGAFTIDAAAARAIIDQALAEKRQTLTEPESKAVLSACAIPTVPTLLARNAAEAGQLAHQLGGRVAVKILSREIVHKSDVGGVALDLEPSQVEAAAAAMAERVRLRFRSVAIDGFAVQPSISRPHAQELILGVNDDAVFGPVILFGQGGVAVERIADRALALPPLNMHLAYDLMRRTRVWRLLEGYRDRKRADTDAVALALIKLSQAIIELPQIVELDINPLLADSEGVIALDARIRIAPARGPGEARLAIRPYPKQLESSLTLRDGTTLMVRPVRPEDEPMFHETFARLDREDVRMRFFVPIAKLSHNLIARLTQIDYDRQMAFVAIETDGQGRQHGLGVVRFAGDPNNETGEYAITLRSDMKGRGLGFALMNRIIDYARQRGLKELFGIVLRDNEAMLSLCRRLGFTVGAVPDDPTIVRVALQLQ